MDGDTGADDVSYLPVPTAQETVEVRRAEPVRKLAASLPAFVKLAYRLVRDGRVPVRRRVFALGALAYVVSPVDIVPDAIPGLGQADDVLVLALALRMLMDAAGPEVVAELWDGPPEALETVDAVVEWGADLVPRSVRRAVRRMFG